MYRVTGLPLLVLFASCSQNEALQPTSDATEFVIPSLAVAGDSCRADWREAYDCDDGFSEDQSEVGECRPGYRLCKNGLWGECLSQNFPMPEVCNRLDDDCNGEVDNEQKDACGRCETVPSIRDCFGQDCERGFNIPLSGTICADECCDCITFTPGSKAALLQTFDMCEVVEDCRTEGSLAIILLAGTTEGLSFEIRSADSTKALTQEPFRPVIAHKMSDTTAIIEDGNSARTLLELRVSSATDANESGTLCRLESQYFFALN